MTTDREASARFLANGFDPAREVLLHHAPDALVGASAASDALPGGRAVITREDTRSLVINAEAPQDGFLLLADTFYPGWTAEVDGVETTIYRANLAVRGIALPKGRHEVRFVYSAPGFFRGLQVSLLAISALLLWVCAAAYADRRSARVSAATR